MQYEWDEAKRLQNLNDHGIDFVDAHQVFSGPTFTFEGKSDANARPDIETLLCEEYQRLDAEVLD